MEQHVQQFINYDVLNRIVSGYEPYPQSMLGPHEVEGGYVVTAYHPSACGMSVHFEGEKEAHEMERVHEMGVFSYYFKTKKYKPYKITKYFEDGTFVTSEDPYSFTSYFTADDCYMFGNGIHYEIYEKLGAHPMEIDGVQGTYFAVWAPYERENIGNEAVFFGIYGEFSFTHRVRYTNMTSKEKYLVHSWRYEYVGRTCVYNAPPRRHGHF